MPQPPSKNWNKHHVLLLRKQYKEHAPKKKFVYSRFSIRSLAEEYEVGYTTMRRALKGETWKNCTI